MKTQSKQRKEWLAEIPAGHAEVEEVVKSQRPSMVGAVLTSISTSTSS